MTTKKKNFDCVGTKREAAEKIWRLLKKMSLKEQLKYWQKGTEEFKKIQQQMLSKNSLEKSKLLVNP